MNVHESDLTAQVRALLNTAANDLGETAQRAVIEFTQKLLELRAAGTDGAIASAHPRTPHVKWWPGDWRGEITPLRVGADVQIVDTSEGVRVGPVDSDSYSVVFLMDMKSGHVELPASTFQTLWRDMLDPVKSHDWPLARLAMGNVQVDYPKSEPTHSDDAEDELTLLTEEQAEAYLDSMTTAPPAHLTAGGEMLGATKMAELLETSRQTIRNRYNRKQIIGLTREVGPLVYPLTQFANTPGGLRWLKGLDAVVVQHGNGWQAWLWLTNERYDLANRTPLTCLREGDVDAVYAALARDDEGAFS
ncbi:hypothetical protein T35B1_18803 [Salinisphaera shabanensis T35B1]|uniref:hypothetical protein n=1 Tax=Salinisphaera shabanensis TaxID=180542 RepID=UPI00333EED36